MIFYILFLITVFFIYFFSEKYPKHENLTSLLVLFIMLFVGCFRNKIGGDYQYYTNWYLYGTRDDNLEFGFVTIMNVFRYFKVKPFFIFFFCTFFTYIFAYLGFKKFTKKVTLSLLLYILIPSMFLYSFTIIRQFLSVAIAFYAFSFLLEKKYYFYIFFMFLGFSIHYTCIIPFVLFAIVKFYCPVIKLKHLLLFMFITFVISQIGIIHLFSLLLGSNHFSYYVSKEFSVSVPILKLLALNFIAFIVIVYYILYDFKTDIDKFFLVLYILAISLLNLFSESIGLTRIYIYFRIFEILVIGELFKVAFQKKKYILLTVFVFGYYVVPFFKTIIYEFENGSNGCRLIPYKNIIWSYLVQQ